MKTFRQTSFLRSKDVLLGHLLDSDSSSVGDESLPGLRRRKESIEDITSSDGF